MRRCSTCNQYSTRSITPGVWSCSNHSIQLNQSGGHLVDWLLRSLPEEEWYGKNSTTMCMWPAISTDLSCNVIKNNYTSQGRCVYNRTIFWVELVPNSTIFNQWCAYLDLQHCCKLKDPCSEVAPCPQTPRFTNKTTVCSRGVVTTCVVTLDKHSVWTWSGEHIERLPMPLTVSTTILGLEFRFNKILVVGLVHCGQKRRLACLLHPH